MLRELNKIIVHSSKSDIGTKKSIEVMHTSKGLKEIGYHFVVERNGHIEKGRSLTQVGEHTVGHNLDSIGICMVGKEDFTSDQLISLGTLVQALLSQYRTINSCVRHCDIDQENGCWFCESEFFDKPSPIIQQ